MGLSFSVRLYFMDLILLYVLQTELISGDQNGNIRVWDLRANSCSCELVPEVDTAVRSLTIMWDGSLIVAANNRGTCYVWRLLRGTETMTNFEPLHKLQAHDGYILKCLLSPELCEPHRYLATASSDHTVKIWNVDGFTLEKTLIGHERWVWDCVFSVDGAFLITGSLELRSPSMNALASTPYLLGISSSSCSLVNGGISEEDVSPGSSLTFSCMILVPLLHADHRGGFSPLISSYGDFCFRDLAKNNLLHCVASPSTLNGTTMSHRTALSPA
ncbi:Protein LST8 -like protein [Capsicum annuum]|nr:Protein LST8 -like protein [Capsicum annuum]